MAITVSFTTAQTVGSPQSIVLTDTSTGSDVLAVNRQIFLRDSSGGYLVPDGNASSIFIDWPLADGNTITLDVLPKDYALNVTLARLDAGGSLLYSATSLAGFTLFNETFLYSLTQAQSTQPNIVQDQNYYGNKIILRTNVDDGNQAIGLGNDIQTAQEAYDRATYLSSQQNLFF